MAGISIRKIARAEEYIQTYKPLLIIGSPMCTMCSIFQNLNEWGNDKQEKYDIVNFFVFMNFFRKQSKKVRETKYKIAVSEFLAMKIGKSRKFT